MSPLRDVSGELDTQRWLQGIDKSLIGVVEALQMIGEKLEQMEQEGRDRLDRI